MKGTKQAEAESQDPELGILQLADFAEKITERDASCYLIVNKKQAEYPCMFGFAQLPDNFDTVQKLFKKMEKRATKLGYQQLIGPMNYDTWMSYRWALNDYDMRYFPDCENPKYYVDFIEKLGYEQLYTYRSTHVKINNRLYWWGKILSGFKRLSGFKFQFLRGDAAFEKVREIFEISEAAFRDAPLYSPIPYEVFEKIYLTWVRKIPEVLAYLVYKNNHPVAFEMGYLNPYNEREFIVKTIAVRPEFQGQKLFPTLLYLGCKQVRKMGLNEVVFHFQCEQKKKFQRQSNKVESNEKRYAMFVKDLV